MPVTRTLTVAALMSLALWTATPTPPSDADTVRCTREIRTVPFTIAESGVYCLTRSFSTAMATGVAIAVEADDVTLDLAGFTLAGAAGPGTTADGIVAEGRRNVTVRDGTVTGFARGVSLASLGGHLVEKVRAHKNVRVGIEVIGQGSSIRRNNVSATGGGTVVPVWVGIGAAGLGVHVIDNDVTDTVDPGEGFAADAINVAGANGAVIEGNRLSNQTVPPHVLGITVFESEGVFVVNNRIANFPRGVTYVAPATGKYRDNLTSNVALPFVGGTPVGIND